MSPKQDKSLWVPFLSEELEILKSFLGENLPREFGDKKAAPGEPEPERSAEPGELELEEYVLPYFRSVEPGEPEPESSAVETISHGTDGLERSFQSYIMQSLSEKDVNLSNLKKILKKILKKLELEWRQRSDPLSAQIKENISNLRRDLLQMLKRNPKMSDAIFSITKIKKEKLRKEEKKRELEESSEEFSELKKELSELKKLRSELKRERRRMVGAGRWTDKINKDWINSLDRRNRPQGSKTKSVEGLLRFVRNRRHHLDKFKISHNLRSPESLFNYFDTRFPDLFKVSYGVVYKHCRKQDWFKELSIPGPL